MAAIDELSVPSADPAPPLDAAALERALIRPGGLWRQITVTGMTGSTNTDLVAAAAAGAAEGVVLAAEAQTAGRGRMGRRWESQPAAALTFSVLLRPVSVPASYRGWLPLLAGVAATAALRQVGVDAVLKWPNDVLVGERKLAGILAEQTGNAIVVGMGVNVSGPSPATANGRPVTSLQAEGAGQVTRQALLVAVLGQLEHWYQPWHADPDECGLREQYRSVCATIGRTVRVELPGGQGLTGTAADIDEYGRLVVAAEGTRTAVSAGDVVHVR
jgi:BirA family biotin operon repressor/biotin-[acetyl-CoA-carboxylase] ligase